MIAETVTYDLVVFGSGFAAYELARVSAAHGQSVAVIEKGTEEPSTFNEETSRVPYRREPIVSGGAAFGAQVPPAFESLPRYVGFGGTSELWSGKWRRLDRLDLERSVDGRQWMLAHSELATYYDRVATDYGWPDWSHDALFAGHVQLAAAHGIRLVDIYEEAPPLRLRPKWADLKKTGLPVDVLCRAKVDQATCNPRGESIRSVRLSDEGGERRIEAANFVVACGGIESIHVSHELRASAARARPTSCPLPARYGGFADHPKAFIGTVSPCSNLPFVEYLQRIRAELGRLIAFSLPEAELAANHLGNHTVFLWVDATPASGRPLQLSISLEQFPEPDNFVALEPTPAVSWRVSQRTWSGYRGFLSLFIPRLTTLIGPVATDESIRFRGASHHAGALFMGEPGVGHLNRDCRFHDVDNLYTVSSAVFPLAGSANPTMTVVALAHRLADYLGKSDRL